MSVRRQFIGSYAGRMVNEKYTFTKDKHPTVEDCTNWIYGMYPINPYDTRVTEIIEEDDKFILYVNRCLSAD